MRTFGIGTVALGLVALLLSAFLLAGLVRAEPAPADPPPRPRPMGPEDLPPPGLRPDGEPPPPVPASPCDARARAWLGDHQNVDGSWGKSYTIAVTGLGCLAFLAGEEKPYEGENAAALVKGIGFLLRQQQDGMFPGQGHTWIHGQGFATLALSEAYGRMIRDGAKPDLDVLGLKVAIAKAVEAIQAHQSNSGGWWYVTGVPHDHEGSTTVCAVQALVSAANHGFPTDAGVLARGFEYLKKCQNPDGGFDYKLGPGTTSMKEGTAGDVATLALMRRFDYQVMTSGVDFLKKIGPGAISKERFPYYGHFYAGMGLVLFGEEMAAERDALAYVEAAGKDLASWQAADGSFPLKGWMHDKAGDEAYATAYAALFFGVPQKRLSIFHRRPAPLPLPEEEPAEEPAEAAGG